MSFYKKNSSNNALAVYLSARDIFDDLNTVDPVEGVITFDRSNLKEKKIFARIRCTFRYGEQSMDETISGVAFFKEFHIQTVQLYPQTDPNPKKLSEKQKRLLDKLGQDAIPFSFVLPHDIPASITKQSDIPTTLDENPIGIQYLLQIFFADSMQSNFSKRNSVSLVIRRLTIAIPNSKPDPYIKELVKPFHFHSGQLTVTAKLPKEIFFHGETIPITITIDNSSSNTVRRIKFQIMQHVETTLFKQRIDKCVVLNMECDKGFPVEAQSKGWQNKYELRPSLQDAGNQPGLALDGKLKHKDTNLASSTLIKDYRKKEAIGMVIQYSIIIKLVTGFGGRNVQLEIPFILSHQRSEQEVVKAEVSTELVVEQYKRPKADRNRQDSVE